MTHLTEEQLLLHYYAEASHGEHLKQCAACRLNYTELARVLDALKDYPVPKRGPEYEQILWQRISPQLARARAWRRAWWLAPALAGLLTLAFLGGRYSMQKPPSPQLAQSAISSNGREKILLVAMGNHLERSQMVLLEIANSTAGDTGDIRITQQRARELVGENRLYRQTAVLTGDQQFTALLDELDRVLTDIAHGTSDLQQVQQRIERDGLIFKIRVVGSNLQEKGTEKL